MEVNYFTEYQIDGTSNLKHFSSDYAINSPTIVKYDTSIPLNENGKITIDIAKLFFQNDIEVLRCNVEYRFSVPHVNRQFVFMEIFDIIKCCVNDLNRIICEKINETTKLPPHMPYFIKEESEEVIKNIVRSAT